MRLALVNPPFASLQFPSLALHQLEAVVYENFGSDVAVEIHYINHDFAALVGQDLYTWICESHAGHTCGFGEWLFRQAAFPEYEDNSETYFARYQHHFGSEQLARYRHELEPVRSKLPQIFDEIIKKRHLHEANIVGLSSMFFQNIPSFALARQIKQRRAETTIVMGGANCEAGMGIEIVNQIPWIDFVFSGHALESFPRFISTFMNGDKAAMQRIDGVFSRANIRAPETQLPKACSKSAVPVEVKLDEIRLNAPERPLDRTLAVNFDSYLDSYQRHFGNHRADEVELFFETSRGCWWGERAHCNFCGLNGATMNFREMEVSKARSNIQQLIDRYASRVKRFASVDNIIPKCYLHELLPELQIPADLTLFYEVRADLNREQLRSLARARVVEVQPGIESLATPTLKLMRKGTTAFNNIRFLADCAAEGVKPIWNLLVGFPGELAETYEAYKTNLPRLVHLPPPSGVFPVRFDRFSPYFTQSEAYNLDLEPLDYHELIYPFPAEVTRNLAYFFRDNNIQASYQVDLAEHLGHLQESVDHWRERWQSSAGTPHLRLVTDAMGWLVEDSRSGHQIAHELEERDVELLKNLERPQSINNVRTKYAEELDYLLETGLLFEERGKVMSLVMEGL